MGRARVDKKVKQRLTRSRLNDIIKGEQDIVLKQKEAIEKKERDIVTCLENMIHQCFTPKYMFDEFVCEIELIMEEYAKTHTKLDDFEVVLFSDYYYEPVYSVYRWVGAAPKFKNIEFLKRFCDISKTWAQLAQELSAMPGRKYNPATFFELSEILYNKFLSAIREQWNKEHPDLKIYTLLGARNVGKIAL